MKILERKFTCKCGTTFEYDEIDVCHKRTCNSMPKDSDLLTTYINNHTCNSMPKDLYLLTSYVICPSCKNYCVLNSGLDPEKHDAHEAYLHRHK